MPTAHSKQCTCPVALDFYMIKQLLIEKEIKVSLYYWQPAMAKIILFFCDLVISYILNPNMWLWNTWWCIKRLGGLIPPKGILQIRLVSFKEKRSWASLLNRLDLGDIYFIAFKLQSNQTLQLCYLPQWHVLSYRNILYLVLAYHKVKLELSLWCMV